MKDPLFTPIKIGTVEIKNRILLPAMHLNMTSNFEVTDQMVNFYAERAKGGVGLISVGFATVDELAGNSTNLGAHKDEFIPGLSRLAKAITDEGAKGAVQLNHSGRYNHSFFLNGKEPVAPSPIASRLTREKPRELTVEEIHGIIESFAQAAKRVKRAGFEVVEVLSGTGYLISEFLSENTNQRTDEWGGTFENRMRFGLSIIKAVKGVIGETPLMVRINGNEFMPGGTSRAQLQEYAQRLVAAGTDAICVNVGWHEARIPQIVTEVPRGVYSYLARGIKNLVDVPVIASHRINDPAVARELLENYDCDMVAMGRSLIADPYLPLKAQEGREKEIVHCVACAQGCFDHLFLLKPVECLCNPRASHEAETVIDKASQPRNVMVIGGGAAGMSAAAAAADRGHRVTLYEKGNRLGGQLVLAGAPPGREEFAQLADDLAVQVETRPIQVRLNSEVTSKTLEQEKPDAVILATGARPITPPIPGIDMPHVVQAWDVLAGNASVGRKVVVIGGGSVGVETALSLADRGTLSGEALKFLLVHRAEDPEVLYELAVKGSKQVVLVEMEDKIGKDLGKSTRWTMMQDIKASSVEVRKGCEVLEISEGALRMRTPAGEETLEADSVVVAAGASPYKPLEELLRVSGLEYQVVGDADTVRKAFDAIHQGFHAGRNL